MDNLILEVDSICRVVTQNKIERLKIKEQLLTTALTNSQLSLKTRQLIAKEVCKINTEQLKMLGGLK